MAESASKSEYFVGVDFGGTKILAAVFDSSLKCLGRTKASTKSERGTESVIERISRCVQDVVDECDLNLKQIRAVGIGAPGAVNPESGEVIFAPNLEWEDVPLKKELEKKLDVPVFLENDGNICTLGVYETELKGKPRNVVGIFLGTGIGGGIIIDGKLYSGLTARPGRLDTWSSKRAGRNAVAEIAAVSRRSPAEPPFSEKFKPQSKTAKKLF